MNRSPLLTPRPSSLAQAPPGERAAIPRLRALAGLTADIWPRCALAAAPLVRTTLLPATCKDSGHCGAFVRRLVPDCARFFELRLDVIDAHMPSSVRLRKSTSSAFRYTQRGSRLS